MADSDDAQDVGLGHCRARADDDLSPEVEALVAECLRECLEGPMEFTTQLPKVGVSTRLVVGRSELVEALPDWVWRVPYIGSHFPGGVPRSSWKTGANCQLFAYEVLALHGWDIPDLTSSDLWLDTTSTAAVEVPQPLDLVLFQKDEQPYGAHVGVVAGEDAVLHLCKEVGAPAIWSWADFAARPRYAVVIGFKRPLRRLPDQP